MVDLGRTMREWFGYGGFGCFVVRERRGTWVRGDERENGEVGLWRLEMGFGFSVGDFGQEREREY